MSNSSSDVGEMRGFHTPTLQPAESLLRDLASENYDVPSSSRR